MALADMNLFFFVFHRLVRLSLERATSLRIGSDYRTLSGKSLVFGKVVA